MPRILLCRQWLRRYLCSVALRERTQRFTGQTKYRPVVERIGADSFIEIDRKLIPVEHCPFESSAIAIYGNSRKLREQSKPNTMTPRFRFHEKIFEVNAALRQKRGVVMKEKSESSGLVIELGNYHFRSWMLAKKRLMQACLG